MVQCAQVLRADMVDDATAVALVDRLAIISGPVFVPDRMTERDVETIDRTAITIDEIGYRSGVGQLLERFGSAHWPSFTASPSDRPAFFVQYSVYAEFAKLAL